MATLLENFNLPPLLRRIGLDELPEDTKVKFKEKISGLLEARVTLAVQSMLTDQELWELEKLKDHEVLSYILEKEIDVEGIAYEEGLKLREELIEISAHIKAKMS